MDLLKSIIRSKVLTYYSKLEGAPWSGGLIRHVKKSNKSHGAKGRRFETWSSLFFRRRHTLRLAGDQMRCKTKDLDVEAKTRWRRGTSVKARQRGKTNEDVSKEEWCNTKKELVREKQLTWLNGRRQYLKNVWREYVNSHRINNTEYNEKLYNNNNIYYYEYEICFDAEYNKELPWLVAILKKNS